MDGVFILTVLFFGGLLVVLGLWQRLVARDERARTIEEIADARERGSSRPLAQHPQIREDLCIGCSSCVRACPEEGVLGLVNGVAHIIHGSRCIGHGKCAEACPVGALSVGLGSVADRTDIPRLTRRLESSVPGVFVAGELGGFALIRNAIEQGVEAMTVIAERTSKRSASTTPDDILDVLIVGAGPTGLAASLKATEAKLRYATISQDDFGGTLRQYPRRKLVMTQPVTLPLVGRLKRNEYRKEELVELWEAIRRRHGLEIDTGVKLLGVTRANGVFFSETTRGAIRSRFLLLALGRRGTPRKLGVPGEDTEKVFYRLIDASTYTGEHVLVVGGGDSAIEAATGLANQPGNVVTLSYRKHAFFRLKPRNEFRIEEYAASGRVRVVFESDVIDIREGSVVLGLRGEARAEGEFEEGGERRLEIPNSQVFIFAGGEPPFPLLKNIGIRFGGEGAVSSETVVEDAREPVA